MNVDLFKMILNVILYLWWTSTISQLHGYSIIVTALDHRLKKDYGDDKTASEMDWLSENFMIFNWKCVCFFLSRLYVTAVPNSTQGPSYTFSNEYYMSVSVGCK